MLSGGVCLTGLVGFLCLFFGALMLRDAVVLAGGLWIALLIVLKLRFQKPA